MQKLIERYIGGSVLALLTLMSLSLMGCEGLPIDCTTQRLLVHRMTMESPPIADTECAQIQLTEDLFKRTFGQLPPSYLVYQRPEPWLSGTEFVSGQTTYHLNSIEVSIKEGWCESSLAHEMLHASFGYNDNHKEWDSKGYYKQIEMIKANCLRGY